MGRHKEKSKKHSKHKKSKKSRRRSTSSSSSSSCSSNEWVEKKVASDDSPTYAPKRDEWMSLSTSFTSTSNLDKRQLREANKRMQKESQVYNPGTSSRELNPYWKDGGDGLPKFQKPRDEDEESTRTYDSYTKRSSTSNWRKPAASTSNSSSFSEIISSSENDSKVLTKGELNILAAKLVKAEIMGDDALVLELKEKLEKAKSAQETIQLEEPSETEYLLTQTDSRGFSRPLKMQADYRDEYGRKKKKQKIETHSSDGLRMRYFADDDGRSLQQMFENEKYNTIEDTNRQFMELAGSVRKNDDLDDIFTDNIRKKESSSKIDKRNKDKAISEHKQINESLETCIHCIQSQKMSKHLMVCVSESVYLSLPPYEPLTDHHCILIPVRHVSCSTQLDENEWTEVMQFRRTLTRMFDEKDQDVIFFETAMFLHRFPHMTLQCIPVDRDQGSLAPIYFKKAIEESENEWSTNKKLVSLKGRDVRRAIPKGLPYFSVSFGMEEGFAHVIEDQRIFPTNFAQEIIGGILDLHHSKWKKPKMQKFDEQQKRISNFSKDWSKFDFTVAN